MKFLSTILFFIITILTASYLWIINNYNSDINIDVILFHIRFPLVGANMMFIYSYILYALIPSILLAILYYFKTRLAILLASIASIVIFLTTDLLKQMSIIAYNINDTLIGMMLTYIESSYYKSFLYNENIGFLYVIKIAMIIALVVIILVIAIWFYKLFKKIKFVYLDTLLLIFIICINLITINNSFNLISLLKPKPYTNFYDTFYTIPKIDTPPHHKTKNLIVMFVESMQIYNSYTPNLKKFAAQNINFSNNNSYGGLIQIGHTGWTIAGMVGYMCGIPLNAPPTINVKHFLSNATCIGDVLHSAGYNQAMLMGSDDNFVAKGMFLKTHKIQSMDIKYFKKIGKIPQDYQEGWGFEDSKLFKLAKDELENLSTQNKPFALYMLTNNTHYPDSYIEKQCSSSQDENNRYKEALGCDDKMINDFVSWIKKQKFYKDTTIIILGDHLPMNSSYKTEVFNVFINPNFSTIAFNSLIKDRKLSHFDIAPLILDSIGFKVKEFGLGRNPLYNQTLLEMFDKKQFVDLVSSNSKKYDSFWETHK